VFGNFGQSACGTAARQIISGIFQPDIDVLCNLLTEETVLEFASAWPGMAELCDGIEAISGALGRQRGHRFICT